MSFAKTDPDGRFTFNAPDGPFLLAAMSDDGYAESRVNFGTLTLQAWGRVKGQAFIGREPAVNQVISIGRRDRLFERNGVDTSYDLETRTDAQGRFVFERVVPGACEVSRMVLTEFGDGSGQRMPCWQEPVDVMTGETVEVRVGGKGRPVFGRVVLRAAPGVRVDWRKNRPATVRWARGAEFDGVPHPNGQFGANLDKEGRFRVEDVPPGHYDLTITIDAPRAPDRPAAPDAELGQAKVRVDVPEGNDGAPVDLGEITAAVKGR
jgi:hypothetical protein